jgi:hypothetical protein
MGQPIISFDVTYLPPPKFVNGLHENLYYVRRPILGHLRTTFGLHALALVQSRLSITTSPVIHPCIDCHPPSQPLQRKGWITVSALLLSMYVFFTQNKSVRVDFLSLSIFKLTTYRGIYILISSLSSSSLINIGISFVFTFFPVSLCCVASSCECIHFLSYITASSSRISPHCPAVLASA